MSAGFIDEVEIHVTGGRGGAGCVAFRREKFVPRGGPSGGDGGAGGAIVLRASTALNTLRALRHRGHYRASDGGAGEGSNRHGKSAPDLVLEVPAGTLVADGGTAELLGDLRDAGQEVVVAAGGRGGRGNARFASSTNRAPRRCEPGEPGEDRWLRLELKLLADVGLVGLPNAGKSTLLSRISAARPKVAAYPFTTLVPHLGVVGGAAERSFVVADIPGLVEGSHGGGGLGDQFLRHVERTSVLLQLVDLSDLADVLPERAVEVVERELECFAPALLERPRVLVGTKVDAATSTSRADALRVAGAARGLQVTTISAVTGEGIQQLVRHAGDLVERTRGLAAGEAEAGGTQADQGVP